MTDNSFEQQPFGDVTFADNPARRCPVVLLLDNSGSMSGQPLDQLNQGLQIFRDELIADSIASKSVEVAIVTFGPVHVETDFTSIEHFIPPSLSSAGNSAIGARITSNIFVRKATHFIKSGFHLHDLSADIFKEWIDEIRDAIASSALKHEASLSMRFSIHLTFLSALQCLGSAATSQSNACIHRQAARQISQRPILPFWLEWRSILLVRWQT
jgi:hypothetical protein